MKSIRILGIICIGLWGCESRFGRYPNADVDRSAAIVTAEMQATFSIKAFDLNDVIQYLKVYERQHWEAFDEPLLKDWLRKYPNDPNLYELVSDYYLTREDLDQALAYNDRAEQLGAHSTDFYKRRAEILASLGQYGLAMDYINKAVMINANDPDIYLTKGEVYLRLGDSLSALRYKEKAFAQDSSREEIAEDLAFLYANAGAIDLSRQFLNHLLRAREASTPLQFLEVDLYRKEGRDHLANQKLLAMVDAGVIQAGMALMDYYHGKENMDSVIYASGKVLEVDSLNLKALEIKAGAFDKQGYYASALQYYEQMLNIDSLNEEALEGVRKVNGKIAYLRKIKERREAIPTFDFASPTKKKMN